MRAFVTGKGVTRTTPNKDVYVDTVYEARLVSLVLDVVLDYAEAIDPETWYTYLQSGDDGVLEGLAEVGHLYSIIVLL